MARRIFIPPLFTQSKAPRSPRGTNSRKRATIRSVEIPEAHDDHWSSIYPMVQRFGHDGTNYALPEPFSRDEAWSWWMPRVLDAAVAAVEGNHVWHRQDGAPSTRSWIARRDREFHCRSRLSGARDRRRLGSARHGVGALEGLPRDSIPRRGGNHEPAVHLWRMWGFEILATVPAFRHRELGLIGVPVMLLTL